MFGPTAEMIRPTAKSAIPVKRTARGPFQSADAPATTVALSCAANAAPEAIGYQGAASKEATTVGMIVVAASSSNATSVIKRTEPIARPISVGVQAGEEGTEEVETTAIVPILFAASVLPDRARVQ